MTTDDGAVKLEPCPFCGQPLFIRKSVNAYGRCETDGCWMRERKVTVPIDDVDQVAAWNTRADRLARGEGVEALIEATAQWLHDEGGFDEAWQATWPEHVDDTGQREGAFVKIVPSDVQAKFRDVARRLLKDRAIVAALRAPPSDERDIPADVRRLVIAARAVALENVPGEREWIDLDKAVEVFASRVPWDDEQGHATAAARGTVDRCDLAVAIAECFLCQPKEMPYEDRADELAEAVIAYLGGTVDREAVIRECAAVAAKMREKWGDPIGTDYAQGAQDQGIRIEAQILALIGGGK